MDPPKNEGKGIAVFGVFGENRRVYLDFMRYPKIIDASISNRVYSMTMVRNELGMLLGMCTERRSNGNHTNGAGSMDSFCRSTA